MVKSSIVVEQRKNHNFTPAKPEHATLNPKLVYIVKKTINTLHYTIGQEMTPNQVQHAIAPDGVQVTIEAEKKKNART